MQLKIDKENDSLYLRLNETTVFESEEIEPGVILDFDKEGNVIGIEILAQLSSICGHVNSERSEAQ